MRPADIPNGISDQGGARRSEIRVVVGPKSAHARLPRRAVRGAYASNSTPHWQEVASAATLRPQEGHSYPTDSGCASATASFSTSPGCDGSSERRRRTSVRPKDIRERRSATATSRTSGRTGSVPTVRGSVPSGSAPTGVRDTSPRSTTGNASVGSALKVIGRKPNAWSRTAYDRKLRPRKEKVPRSAEPDEDVSWSTRVSPTYTWT